MEKIIIIGAGLAGATAAALLKDTYHVTVYEQRSVVGGLLYDRDGFQQYGPRAFHTDSAEIWTFVTSQAEFLPYHLRVFSFIEPQGVQELPLRPEDNVIFRVYSEKAWGKPFHELPPFITDRVPQYCTDTRIGYHPGIFKGQPIQGYSALVDQMLQGVTVHVNRHVSASTLPTSYDALIWTGDINDYVESPLFPWVGRSWVPTSGSLPHPIVNYGTHLVPQIRSYDCARLNPEYYDPVVVSEFYSTEHICYPYPSTALQEQARKVTQAAQQRRHWLCGRFGSYQYLDMDATITDVLTTLKQAQLISS